MIVLENIFKSYSGKNGTAEALKGVSLHVGKGDFISVSGSSGSGKTTLMNIIGCLDRPTKGRYLLEGEDIGAAAENRRGRVRNGKIGFVFQSFNLISNMTALENVALPLAIRGWDRKSRIRAAEEALAEVGLSDRLYHKPSQLSGGQRQRVAVARVTACKTPVILADEPTGSLDPRSASEIMKILQRLNEKGAALILITHDRSLEAMAPRRYVMSDGRMYPI